MLAPETLADVNVTESVGADGLAAFVVGTISIAAAAMNATKPRRLRVMCGLLWRTPVAHRTTTPLAAAAAKDGRGLRPPSVVCAPTHIGRVAAQSNPPDGSAAPGGATSPGSGGRGSAGSGRHDRSRAPRAARTP